MDVAPKEQERGQQDDRKAKSIHKQVSNLEMIKFNSSTAKSLLYDENEATAASGSPGTLEPLGCQARPGQSILADYDPL
jgi:hypothetical protein